MVSRRLSGQEKVAVTPQPQSHLITWASPLNSNELWRNIKILSNLTWDNTFGDEQHYYGFLDPLRWVELQQVLWWHKKLSWKPDQTESKRRPGLPPENFPSAWILIEMGLTQSPKQLLTPLCCWNVVSNVFCPSISHSQRNHSTWTPLIHS